MKKKKQDTQNQEGWEAAAERGNGTDYDEYDMGVAEKLLYCMAGMVVLFLVGYVFYQNLFLAAFLALFGLKYPKMRKKQIIKNRKNKLTLQFKDMLYSLSSAVGAGNSVERALAVTLEDMRQQYNDPNAFIIKELELMTARLSMNRTVEEVVGDFAKRSHIEDIQTFSNIFGIAKRTGGNLIEIIRNTTQIIADKIETKMEIETLIAGQKMEQKVLTIFPVVLVFFMTKTAGDLMKPIFETWVGRGIATTSLVIILIGTIWSKKISDIEF